MEPEPVYEVEEVRGEREGEDGGLEYLIHWRGFPDSEDCWAPASCFASVEACPAVIEFKNRRELEKTAAPPVTAPPRRASTPAKKLGKTEATRTGRKRKVVDSLSSSSSSEAASAADPPPPPRQWRLPKPAEVTALSKWLSAGAGTLGVLHWAGSSPPSVDTLQGAPCADDGAPPPVFCSTNHRFYWKGVEYPTHVVRTLDSS
eukprot:TRINITY_DN47660_c0_g1_i1.p1 TRINITY_DN47660_c0_g1~~TRINITY_DN47660_c0_g1_i1.p1  ORF type:complete len:203 (+),score=42.40 TRINITY_DN47660_c0_g1_i1:74-682(+)